MKTDIPLTAPMWAHYSQLLTERILAPLYAGKMEARSFEGSDMRLVTGRSECDGEWVVIQLVVDCLDGIVAEAKFQAFGSSALIGAAEGACAVSLRKSYRQVQRLSADFIDRKLRDFPHIAAFPSQATPALNMALEALDACAAQCTDMALGDPSSTPPVPIERKKEGEALDWQELSHEEKLAAIREVIEAEIQPYIELDAGGIEVLALENDREVVIAYQGACTTCPSSTGATLQAIEQMLRSQVYKELTVKPDLSFLAI